MVSRLSTQSLRSLRTSINGLTGVSALAVAINATLPSSSYAADSLTLEEITVTARRVEERLQDIPGSVYAIGSDKVDSMQSLDDIQSMVSGVTFQTFGSATAVGIRGFGNRTQAGNPSFSTVGIFQDGVFINPSLVPLVNRIDSERIEVAKGPQSTLYGRSSFAGAINMVSSDPESELSGYIDTGYGESSVHGEELWSIKGAVSVPISDTLALRFFGLREQREGYTYDSVTGNRGNGYDRKIGRIRALWTPSDSVTARLTGTVMRDDVPFGLVRTGEVPSPLGQTIPFGNPFDPAIQAGSTRFPDSVWDGSYAQPQKGEVKGEQVTFDLRVETAIGEFASLTDYQNSESTQSLTVDASPFNLATGNASFDEERYSQEFRLAGNSGNLSYLTGLYYLHDVTEQSGGKDIDLDVGAVFRPGSVQYDLAGLRGAYQPTYTKTEAYAAFVQLGYDFTERLNLTGGLRWGQDEISGTTSVFLETIPGFLIPATPQTYREDTFEAITGNINLSYEVAPDVIVYASYARGNSPGGLNTGGAALVSYDEQSADAYELGLKSQLFDYRLQLNVALFNNEYSDLQLSQNIFIDGALTPLTTNAGEAKGRGVDVDITALLSSHWRVGLQYTYVDSEITEYTVPASPAPQVDITGAPMVRSPEHSANLSITYTNEIGPGELEVEVQQTYSSSYTNDYLGVPAGTAYPGIPGQLAPGVTTGQVLALYRTDSYSLTNLNASYTWGDWQVRGYVRNLFDEEYIGSVLAYSLTESTVDTPGEPRTIGASVKYNF
ncbi:TonB-dependent receptor [Aestuariicella hydrocarbonica]|uniref:TonB-dependent receptor n=1 Tax=Pseudomaricurvus hydrocarbonicus TaxID=1470433 RepID=A0A9E5T4Q6_9GAMM|nr:TonB-dependent receptor [Aestuariicella hydrocarbonica]NHO68343.1 TonB-dependent receptor [Aestuariicella hydrocarbonica]